MESKFIKFLDKASKVGTWICAGLFIVLVIYNLL